MQDSFSKFHPLVNFSYFVAVMAFSMFIMHPVFLAISLLTSFAYSLYLSFLIGKSKTVLLTPLLILPIMLFNTAFNHGGATILSYLPGGNPLTLESIIYGGAAGCLMVSVLLWFICFTLVITTDKFIYLFGRIIPSLSLVISMALRFIPRFINQFKAVSASERAFGRDISKGGLISRIKNAVRILSITVSWSMENAIETADSMKSRGYGLPERTAFSPYCFEFRDKVTLTVIFILTVYVAVGLFTDSLYYNYLPIIKWSFGGAYSISVYIAYSILCLIPMAVNVKEELKWKSLRSKI